MLKVQIKAAGPCARKAPAPQNTSKLSHWPSMSTPLQAGKGRTTRARARNEEEPLAQEVPAPLRKKRSTKKEEKPIMEEAAPAPAPVAAGDKEKTPKEPTRITHSRRTTAKACKEQPEADEEPVTTAKRATRRKQVKIEDATLDTGSDAPEPTVKPKATSKRSKATNAKEAETKPKQAIETVQRKAGASGATRQMEEQLWAQAGDGRTCLLPLMEETLSSSASSLCALMHRTHAGVQACATLQVGVDEAGRGPLAGPVVAAACYLPPGVDIPGVADSKQLDETKREAMYAAITTTPGVAWAVQVVDHTTIDRINILQATLLGMKLAASNLPSGHCDYMLIDGNRLPKDLPVPAQAIIQGDSSVFCIAAASILAKVTRDRIMTRYHEEYPQWNFAQHKGYAVPAHYEALNKHGVSAIHRRSFQPIRGMTGWTREAQLKQEAENAANAADAVT